MSWSKNAWGRNIDLIDSIKQLPFIIDLANGSLTIERFRYFILQDRIYIKAFSDTLNILQNRVPLAKDKAALNKFADEAIGAEKHILDSLGDLFPHDYIPVPSLLVPNRANKIYCAYERDIVENSSLQNALAVLLPCFWVYSYIGLYIYSLQKSVTNNPYKAWIEGYGDKSFMEQVDIYKRICDSYACLATEQEREQMNECFTKAIELEINFWRIIYEEL